MYLLFKSTGIWKIAADSGWIMGNKKETDRTKAGGGGGLAISGDFYNKNAFWKSGYCYGNMKILSLF